MSTINRAKAKAIVLISVALGTQERCREDIDKMYDTMPKEYYKAFVGSGLGKSRVFEKFTVATSEYIKKCFSIVLYDFTHDRDLFITKLIKKAYKPAYTFYTHRTSKFFLEEFVLWYSDKMGGIEKTSGIYLDYCFYVLHYLSAIQGDKLVEKGQLFNTINVQYDSMLTSPRIEDMLEENEIVDIEGIIKPNDSGYLDFLNEIAIKGRIGEDISLIFEDIKLNEEEYLMRNGILPTSPNSELPRMPFAKIINTMLILLETFGIDASLVRESKVENKLLRSIVRYIHVLKNANGLSDRDTEVVFIPALIIYALAKEYNNLRKVLYEGVKSKLIEKELEFEDAQSKERERLEFELTKQKEKTNDTEKKLFEVKIVSDSKSKELKELELELKRTKQDLQKAKEYEKELFFLRDYYFNSQQDDETNELDIGLSIDTVLKSLSSVKGVIVGGHTNLQNKLKEVLPNFTFIKTEEASRDISFIRNRDIIFLISVNNKHGLYNKVMSSIKTSDIEITYLPKSQNIESLCNVIYKNCEYKGVLREKLSPKK